MWYYYYDYYDYKTLHFHDTCTSAWIQATLPVSAGGIEIRRAVQLAPSAFLASTAGTRSIIYDVTRKNGYPAVEEAKLAWNGNLNHQTQSRRHGTHHWDKPL